MLETHVQQALGVILAPLLGAALAGFGGQWVGRRGAHCVTILGVGVSFLLSLCMAWQVFFEHHAWSENLYRWAQTGDLHLAVGFMIDPLTVLMMLVVTSISLLVHLYTIGYMKDDPGYQRFFSYISLFTFSMLVLVMSNNFLQLFFGWEAVGLVSYLLIGFWYKRDSAIFANLKAFLVNRVGDFGLLLGIAAIYGVFHSLDYQTVFDQAGVIAHDGVMIEALGFSTPVLTFICIGLFIGAMGKSAQVPLHVWLPDSMEGPTPISALIHAATMVTAGIFMVSRMSPLFEHSETALNFMLCIGATTCFFMGLLGLVQEDIKRVIAYSTLSQLGYMVVALGASAYGAAMFHLMTHAFFKALLFLGAGAVIIALHHEQDMRRMGGLRTFLPITYITMLIGSLALIGFPGFSGFYSKDLIIEAVSLSTLPAATYAHWAVLGSVFVTALYSFRLFFMVFHGKSRMDAEKLSHVHEVPWVVWLPLVLLAIPSVMSGALFVGPLFEKILGHTLFVLPQHDVLAQLAPHYEHGAIPVIAHGFTALPFLLALAGFVTAWVCYIAYPQIPKRLQIFFPTLYLMLLHKYGFDSFNQRIIMPLIRGFGWVCWRFGDRAVIDGLCVNGSANMVGLLSQRLRRLQSGYLYHYGLVMIVGVLAALCWLDWPW